MSADKRPAKLQNYYLFSDNNYLFVGEGSAFLRERTQFILTHRPILVLTYNIALNNSISAIVNIIVSFCSW